MVVNIEQVIPNFLIITFVILLVSLILRIFKQPYVVGYILAGTILGLLGIISDKSQLSFLGELGILLLMFFVGMEISLPKLISKWKVAILGPIFQVILSVGSMYLFGHFLNWSLEKSILIGFIITLSSTAVIIKILEDRNELKTKVGQSVLGILIVQDIAAVPMMIIIGSLGGTGINFTDLIIKIIGAVIVISLLYLILTKRITIPLPKKLVESRELQVFTALIICFGLASLTSFFGLSAALGAFFAGMIVASYRATEWAHDALHPLKVIFVALFFLYIGIMIDLNFIKENILTISMIVLFVFIINTLINSLILKLLGARIRESIYAGSLLAQIGEFSFLVGAIGLSSGIIKTQEYNLIISVISLTLLLSPIWINVVKKVMKINTNYLFEEISKQFELTNKFPKVKKKRGKLLSK
ncbi:MAG: cation:proton antiporter [Candidatus Woesearchaeota archaeon]